LVSLHTYIEMQVNNIKIVKMYCSVGSVLTAVVLLHFWSNKYFEVKLPMSKIAGLNLLDAFFFWF
jgi:hypothetical protein